MSDKLDKFYMDIAKRTAELSYCERAKVGCIAVKDGNILGFGYNGTPSGWENVCELVDSLPNWADNIDQIKEEDRKHYVTYKTKPEVLHAEQNLICKAARDGHSLKGSTLYCTMMPCVTCAILIIQSGITRVVVDENYKCDKGYLALTSELNKHPIEVCYIKDVE